MIKIFQIQNVLKIGPHVCFGGGESLQKIEHKWTRGRGQIQELCGRPFCKAPKVVFNFNFQSWKKFIQLFFFAWKRSFLQMHNSKPKETSKALTDSNIATHCFKAGVSTIFYFCPFRGHVKFSAGLISSFTIFAFRGGCRRALWICVSDPWQKLF